MSQLEVVMDALEVVVGAALDGWNGYASGFELLVDCPAFIVGLPAEVEYGAGPKGRARYTLPITGAVDLTAPRTLAGFLSHDGLAETLQGAEHEAWFGGLLVTRAADTRLTPNGTGQALAADLFVTFLA